MPGSAGFEDRPDAARDAVAEFLHWVEPNTMVGGCTLQLRHPQYGWLNFPFSAVKAHELSMELKQYCKECAQR